MMLKTPLHFESVVMYVTLTFCCSWVTEATEECFRYYRCNGCCAYAFLSQITMRVVVLRAGWAIRRQHSQAAFILVAPNAPGRIVSNAQVDDSQQLRLNRTRPIKP